MKIKDENYNFQIGIRGEDWHYLGPKKDKNINFPKRKAKVSIPKQLTENISNKLKDYQGLCAIRYGYANPSIAICAIPNNGGPYKALIFHASITDVIRLHSKKMKSKFLEKILETA